MLCLRLKVLWLVSTLLVPLLKLRLQLLYLPLQLRILAHGNPMGLSELVMLRRKSFGLEAERMVLALKRHYLAECSSQLRRSAGGAE